MSELRRVLILDNVEYQHLTNILKDYRREAKKIGGPSRGEDALQRKIEQLKEVSAPVVTEDAREQARAILGGGDAVLYIKSGAYYEELVDRIATISAAGRASVWHYNKQVGARLCGNDEPNSSATELLNNVTCVSCLRLACEFSAATAVVANTERCQHLFERDALGEAIAQAAIKAGIINGKSPLDGPQLLMLCEDLAAAALAVKEKQTD